MGSSSAPATPNGCMKLTESTVNALLEKLSELMRQRDAALAEVASLQAELADLTGLLESLQTIPPPPFPHP